MTKMIKCSTGGIENKVIKREDLKPLPTSPLLLNILKNMPYFDYPIKNFSPLFENQKDREEFYLSYFRENTNNIEALLNQPANGNIRINTFTSKKVIEIYKKNNE